MAKLLLGSAPGLASLPDFQEEFLLERKLDVEM